MDSHNITTVSVAKDLGIYVTNNLKWSHHIVYIQHNASICAYQILQFFIQFHIYLSNKLLNQTINKMFLLKYLRITELKYWTGRLQRDR